MDIGPQDTILLYLFENKSFESAVEDEVASMFTKEAVALKCGLTIEELEHHINELKKQLTIKKKKIKLLITN